MLVFLFVCFVLFVVVRCVPNEKRLLHVIAWTLSIEWVCLKRPAHWQGNASQRLHKKQ